MSFVGVLTCNQRPQTLERTNRAASDPSPALAVGDRCLGSARKNVCTTTNKMIYGEDDRLDLHCLERAGNGVPGHKVILKQSESVAAIFHKHDTLDLKNGHYKLGINHTPMDQVEGPEGLCSGQTFADQPRGASCGAVLVRANTILTARHCFDDIPNPLFVFGFAMRPDVPPGFITVPDTNVCKPAKNPRVEHIGNMLTLMDIECPPGLPRPHVTIAEATPTSGDVYAIGFPRALPAKFSGWGPISRPSPGAPSFHAAIDVSPGNSGGPVFAANPAKPAEHKLIGILEGDKGNTSCSSRPNCWIWDTAKVTSKIKIVITPTHEVPKRLALRNTAMKGNP